MLTRIVIDGFKTFESFAPDRQPFSAIVGPNASGKSNLFDAILFPVVAGATRRADRDAGIARAAGGRDASRRSA